MSKRWRPRNPMLEHDDTAAVIIAIVCVIFLLRYIVTHY